MNKYAYYTNDPDQPLCYVHYLDADWYRVPGLGRAIYGDPQAPGDDGVSNDRIDRDRWDEAMKQVELSGRRFKLGAQKTARDYSALFSAYLGYPVEIVVIFAGIRPFDGYSWHYFKWRKVEVQQ